VLSLAVSFDFARWVTELIKIPGTNFRLEFGFAWRRTFLGMGHLARSAFKYVQIGQTVEPSRLSSEAHGLRAARAMWRCRPAGFVVAHKQNTAFGIDLIGSAIQTAPNLVAHRPG
jgi:hypothetical protein